MDFEQLKASVNRGVVATSYLFHGPERYLREKALTMIKAALLPEEVRDFNLDLLDAKTCTVDQIITSANTLPFMADKRLIIVDNCVFLGDNKGQGSLDQDSMTLLRDYVTNPNTGACLILIAPDTARTDSKLYKEILKAGQVVNFSAPKKNELAQWVLERAKVLGKNMVTEAAHTLVSLTGENMSVLNNELEKLVTYKADSHEITVDDVTELVGSSVELSIFKLIDAVLARRYDSALEMARELLRFGEHTIKIFVFLVNQYRLLLQVLDLSNKGYSEKQIAAEVGKPGWMVAKALRQAKSMGAKQAMQALRHLEEGDYAIKTGRQDPVLALELTLLKLCKQ